MGMVGEACLSSNAYYPRTPDYTLYFGVHVCWSESSFVYRFMSLDYHDHYYFVQHVFDFIVSFLIKMDSKCYYPAGTQRENDVNGVKTI